MKHFLIFILILLAFSPTFSRGRRDSSDTGTSSVINREPLPLANSSRVKPPSPPYKMESIEGDPLSFDELWGYVMSGKEKEALETKNFLTDLCLFAAEIDSYGRLSNVPKRSSIRGFSGRVHLVLVSDSRSLTHFALDPTYGLVDTLIIDILKASEKFDGVQVDYELIPKDDIENFHNFLSRLSSEVHKLGKVFSVCVPARTRLLKNDPFPYSKIKDLADKVIVMAYDEHWSTSAPGPVASIGFASKVSKYSEMVIGTEKLVMGLPFYGRSWASEKVAQGWYFSGISRIMREHSSSKVRYISGVPHTKVNMRVHVDCYFEDAYSVYEKAKVYKLGGTEKLAFWRMGQEDPRVWDWIKKSGS